MQRDAGGLGYADVGETGARQVGVCGRVPCFDTARGQPCPDVA
jgi:hypothetical protein